MSQEKTFEAAKEGNPQAIAAMINKSLGVKGITVKASSSNGCLSIIAESQEIPKQDVVVDFLRNGINKLNPSGVSKVIVRGRASGQTTTAWQGSFNLRSSETEVSSDQIDSTITNSFSPMPNNSNSSRILINNSKTGDNALGSPSINQTSEGIKTQSLRNPLRAFGWFLFSIGSGMLLIGLTYDPTVSSGDFGSERTYNIGAINIKNTYTNTGGFVAVCGAIFATCAGSQIVSKGDRN